MEKGKFYLYSATSFTSLLSRWEKTMALVGPFDSKEAAMEAAEKLAEKGAKVHVIEAISTCELVQSKPTLSWE